VEVLTPDFQGDRAAVATVVQAGPDVFNHNVETVGELYPTVRPQAGYRQSLEVLRLARELAGPCGRRMYTKSGLMVGLGESDEQVVGVLRDLRSVDCDVLTIGQYLAPSAEHHPVERYVPPEQFERWGEIAREMGFVSVASGPFVRSSYHADLVFPDED
jgi:lipoic acid synthetase